MNDFFGYVASAVLPVAVVLLILGATARGVLWAQIDDPRWQRLARTYLEPLSTWSVVGFIVYALTLTAAGKAAAGPLAIALVLAVAAAVLRVEGDEAPASEPRASAPSAPSPAASVPPEPSVVAPAHGLFDGPGEPAAPGGLWARSER